MTQFNFYRVNKQLLVTNAKEFNKRVISEDAYNMAREIAGNLGEYVTAIIANRVLYLVAPTYSGAKLYCVVAVDTEEGVKFYDDEGNEIAILNGDIAFTELDDAMELVEAKEKLREATKKYLDEIIEQELIEQGLAALKEIL